MNYTVNFYSQYIGNTIFGINSYYDGKNVQIVVASRGNGNQN